jgi:hypothetical protein
MAMTQEEKRQANQENLMLSIRAQVDREESEYPQKELNRSLAQLKRNASSLYTGAEIDNALEKERTKRFEERRAEVLAKRPEQEAANPLGARTGRATMLVGGQAKLDKNNSGSIDANDFKMLRSSKAKGGQLVEIDETYSNIKRSLSKKQDKAIQNLIAQKRIKDYSVLGRGMNMADKATSLAVRGNTDIVIESPNEKQMYISLGQKMIDGEKRIKKAEGGEMGQQMDMLMGMEQEQTMLPDEEMEEDYVDYVIEETLSNEDRNYLIDALEKDDKLSEIFDQVVESATEFTGSGTVEGPGTGRSDSIPARLSDGEFVFTAKATEEIGADSLMSMMNDAEAAVDERQTMADGGEVEEEETVYKAQPEPQTQDIRVTKETVGSQAMMKEEEDLVGDELKKSMLSTRAYVRS